MMPRGGMAGAEVTVAKGIIGRNQIDIIELAEVAAAVRTAEIDTIETEGGSPIHRDLAPAVETKDTASTETGDLEFHLDRAVGTETQIVIETEGADGAEAETDGGGNTGGGNGLGSARDLPRLIAASPRAPTVRNLLPRGARLLFLRGNRPCNPNLAGGRNVQIEFG